MAATEKTEATAQQSKTEAQRLYDRSRPEYSQAKGHNQRVKERYPEAWAKSTITNESLTEWVMTAKMLSCPYCADPVKEIDHKHPLSKGGEHSFENLQMLCLDCNRSKHDMTDEEFREVRAKTPKSKRGLTLSDYGLDPKVLKDAVGRYRTQSLFVETWKRSPYNDLPPVFTLKGDDDRDGLISLKRVYIATGDPTEYRFAVGLFKDPKHWKHLCSLGWFKPYLERWRIELRAKLRSDAIYSLIEMAKENLPALKTLATEDFIYTSFVDMEDGPLPGSKKRVGRPNKDKPDDTPSEETLADDAARIGLK